MEYEIARRKPRYSFVVEVEMTDVRSEDQIKTRTKTLSLFGCGVNSSKLFAKGTTVRIKLSHRGTEVKASAKVVYASSDLGMGVAFTSLEPEDEMTLEGWIADVISTSIQTQ